LKSILMRFGIIKTNAISPHNAARTIAQDPMTMIADSIYLAQYVRSEKGKFAEVELCSYALHSKGRSTELSVNAT
jgi:hypothetical protein